MQGGGAPPPGPAPRPLGQRLVGVFGLAAILGLDAKNADYQWQVAQVVKLTWVVCGSWQVVQVSTPSTCRNRTS